MTRLGILLRSLGLLHVVNAWIEDTAEAAQDAATQAAQAAKGHTRDWPQIDAKDYNWPVADAVRGHSGRRPRSSRKNLLNQSYANSVVLKQPNLPPPAADLPEVLRHIRCCNAYASHFSLQVFHKDQKIMNGIAYGFCEEQDVAIRVGDPLQLQVNNQQRVAFLSSNMIETDSLLLLVAYQGLKDDYLKFKSHVYKRQASDGESASVVTMNIYDDGKYYRGWKMQISDDEGAKTYRSETLSDLEQDATVSVHPGKYMLTLKRGEVVVDRQKFIAQPNRLYSILRIGSGKAKFVDDQGKKDFPNEIVVFPKDQPNDKKSKSAAWEIRSTLAFAIAFVLYNILQN